MYSNFKNLCFVLLLLSFLQSAIGQVGINTATPLSMLDINGNLTIKEVGIANANVAGSTAFFGGPSGNAKLIDDGVYVSLTPTSGNVEFIVPDAATVPGRIYILRNISASLNALLYSFGGKFYAKDSKDPTPPTGTSFLTLPSNALLKTVIVISDGENWTYFF
jgi:hypothetical protein